MDKYRVSVITFETELYSGGPVYRDMSRNDLWDHGYCLVASDVNNIGDDPFEDWWIDPTLIDKRFARDLCVMLKFEALFADDYFFIFWCATWLMCFL